ncbi:hypothetical protein Poli38472_003035 [Pythium oligandrum]|uniref:PARP-type domain-containing protein n=1 Tax=Pythium oligandrum TaxID=41045 RepID=A0A8K1C695_PYTOL|nr:hypothetical protein Poli38472_003035 [Pythium oligandrum]|eukprot:TMW57110.1 hypothetical protein Poli38472_003035 [Pythium oligandrum]
MAQAMRVLTFNIWFDPMAMRQRMRAIGQLVERHRPAVIGFQEVTRDSLAILKAQQWAKYYDCSVDVALPFSEAYFCVLFSALPVLGLETMPFAATGMGRELVSMRVQVTEGHSLMVGTSHLESLPQFQRARISQLRESMTVLSESVDAHEDKSDNCLGAIFMGDTNLFPDDIKFMDPRSSVAAAQGLTVEEAKTGRSKCRACSEHIAKSAVRVGKNTKDKLPNGRVVEIIHWYHKQCFLDEKTTTSSEKEAVDNFGSQAQQSEGEEERDRSTIGLPPHWRDLWLTVAENTETNGYTYDGQRNGVIKNKSHRSRFDRMYWYPGPKARVTATSPLQRIELIGTEPITDGLWPSDHFGLLSTFSFDPFISGEKATQEVVGGSRDAPIEIDGDEDTQSKKRRVAE